MSGRVFVVGVGPGRADLLTPQAACALELADVIVGYSGYFPWVEGLIAGKERIALPLGQERERARIAVERAAPGRTAAVISSGDPGIYAMASVVLEALEAIDEARRPSVEIVPGVSALNAAAALLGAPLGHDFAAVSLSDLLTPWPMIERRIRAAAGADFVIALFNPKSERRDWQLGRARDILLACRSPATPIGIVRNAFRPEQSIRITTIEQLDSAATDMFTIVIVGNSSTRRFGDMLVTPRGYDNSPTEQSPTAPRRPADIVAESFRIIDAEVGPHRFNEREWPIVRRMIHAAGDVELVHAVRFQHDAAHAAIAALQRGTPIVTDVTMLLAGIDKAAAKTLDVPLHCFLNDVGIAGIAQETALTRSAAGIERAIGTLGDAIYVIGNAPTALLALCEAVRYQRVRPALVIAMPVGFVAVEESKAAAFALPVPVIGVAGRKGGSAMAAAAVNALLHWAVEERR